MRPNQKSKTLSSSGTNQGKLDSRGDSLEIAEQPGEKRGPKATPPATELAIFALLPTARTVTVQVASSTGIARVQDLYKQLAQVAGLEHAGKFVQLSHQGRSLTEMDAPISRFGVKPLSTIQVSVPLLGGTDIPFDEKFGTTLPNQPTVEADKERDYTKEEVKINLKMKDNQGEDETWTDTIEANLANKTFEQFKIEVEKKVKGVKSSRILDNNATFDVRIFKEGKTELEDEITTDALLEQDEDPKLLQVFQKRKIIPQLEQGEWVVNLVIERSSDIKHYSVLLAKIPFFNYQMQTFIKKHILTNGHQTRIKRYALGEFLEHDSESIKCFLMSLSSDQRHSILNELMKQPEDLETTLEFLLKKNHQWTDISANVNKVSTFAAQHQVAQRLLGKNNITFRDEDMTEANEDYIIIDLLMKQNPNPILKRAYDEMLSKQRVQLLLTIIGISQAPEIIKKMLEACPHKISTFWETLDKQPRMQIWDALSNETKLRLLFNDRDNVQTGLDLSQSKRLWDNIGSENRRELWEFIDEDREKKKQFLAGMTTHQQITLWSALGSADKVQLFQLLGELDADRRFSRFQQQLWRTMSHKGRSTMIKQMQIDDLKKLFSNMQIEDRSLLLGMLNESVNEQLIETLNISAKNDLFFYQEFNMREKTNSSSKQFVDSLINNFYTDNNQRTPFARIEHGYVQCVPNPKHENSFITVQIVKPPSKTDNAKIDKKQDGQEDFYELETDEARRVGSKKVNKNDQFRMVENRYGHLAETEPNSARNASEMGIISYWSYSEERGFWCDHSFYVPNPVPFKVDQESINQTVLYKGRNDEMFFFNFNETVSLEGDEYITTRDLHLQILTLDSQNQYGELARSSNENCLTSRIHKDTDLYDYILKGNHKMEHYNDVYFMNSVPTLIQEHDLRFLVYSKCSKGDSGPATYFYDVNKQTTVCRIPGAEIFIDYFPDPNCEDDSKETAGQVVFLCNRKVMANWTWDTEIRDQKEAGKFYSQELAKAGFEDDTMVINIPLPLMEFHSKCSQNDIDQKPQDYPKRLDDQQDSKIDYEQESYGINNQRKSIIKVTQDRNPYIDRWRYRYSRDMAVHVITQPQHRDLERGHTVTFTLLFENYFSMTFTIAFQKEQLYQEALKKQKEEDELAALKEKEKKDNEKSPSDVDNNPAEESKNQGDDKPSFGQSRTHLEYKVIYIVPDAQFVFIDNQSSQDQSSQAQKKPGQQSYGKIYVQTCAKQEQNYPLDSIQEKNQFYVYLYNITDDNVSLNTKTRVPTHIQTPIHINKEAMQSYISNMYGGKNGGLRLNAIVAPLSMTYHGTQGAILYTDELINVTQHKIHWFQLPKFQYQEIRKIQQPLKQSVLIDYPLMLYKGFAPDNRELILANLADKQQPQKVIHLFNMQFISFVGHDFADRQVKLGFLAIENENEVKLCWLECKKPFEKKDPTSYDDFDMIDIPIRFFIPVLDCIQDIQRVEFIRYRETRDTESRMRKMVGDDKGALIVQTSTQIFFSQNHSGAYQNLAYNSMEPILFLRGFNSHFYFVQKAKSGNDQLIMEVKAKGKKDGTDWDCMINSIFKVNEGKILALELDPENTNETDSIYTYDRDLVQERPHVLNKLYIVDDHEDLHLIAQEEEGAGSKYVIEKTTNLSTLKNIQAQLAEFKLERFSSMSITSRCLTFNEINYNFANGQSWPLNISTKEIAGKELVERDSDDDVVSDEPEEDEDLDKIKKKVFYKVHSVRNVSWTQRQLIVISIQQVDKNGEWHNQELILTKMLPGTRRADLVGMRCRRDMDSINLISDDKYLIKLISALDSGQMDYWTVVDKYGQIHDLPSMAKKYLTWSTFSAGVSRQLKTGCLVVTKGGEKEIVSMATDMTTEEKRIQLLEFDQQGQLIQFQYYRKENFLASLKTAIEYDLIKNSSVLIKDLPNNFLASKQWAESITSKVELSENVFCSEQGDLYRIATLAHEGFRDEVAVNIERRSDQLKTGLYVVRPSHQDMDDAQFLKKRDKDLKIILFLCKNKTEQRKIHRAGFVICGKYLCWQYQDQKYVNVLDMVPFNKLCVKPQAQIFQYLDDIVFDVNALAEATVDQIQIDQQHEFNRPLTPGSSMFDPSRNNSFSNGLATDEMVFEGEKELAESVGLRAQRDLDVHQTGLVRSITTRRSQYQKKSSSFFKRFTKNRKPREFFNQVENVEFVSTSAILWNSSTTRLIDLTVMMENDIDSKNTRLCDMPNSTQLSIVRNKIGLGDKIVTQVGGKRLTKSNKDVNLFEADMRRDILQVTINNQVIVFDLSEHDPKEVMFMNATNQFMHPDNYVDSGIQMGLNREADQSKNQKNGHFFDYIVTSRDKQACFWRRDRVFYQNNLNNQNEMEKPPMCLAMFKQYSEVDLIELKRIQKVLQDKRKIDNIDFQSMVGNYEGHTMFSIFHDEEKLHEQIFNQLQEVEWENEVQEDESEIQHNLLRRLYRILTMPVPDMVDEKSLRRKITQLSKSTNIRTPRNKLNNKVLPELAKSQQPQQSQLSLQTEPTQEDDIQQQKLDKKKKRKKSGLYSVLQKSLFNPSQRIRDLLMSITNMCEECQLSDFAQNQQDMQILFENVSGNFLELVQDSFVETFYTKKIMNVLWYTETNKVTFRLNKSIITENECEYKIVNEIALKNRVPSSRLNKTQVEVRIANIDWLLADKQSFVNFVYILKQQKSEKIYQTELLDILLDEFWEDNFNKIFWKILIPWACWMLCTMYFYMTVLQDGYGRQEDNFEDKLYEYILSGFVVIFLVWQIYIECIQSTGVPVLEYFTNVGNIIDLYCFLASLWIVVVSLLEVEIPSLAYQRLMAAFALLFMWIKVLDWLRLFQETSFFIKLLMETMWDIRFFVCIFLCALASFGCALYMLELNKPQENEDVLPDVFGQFFVNSVYNQYMLSLGEFAMDGFDDHPQMLLCYIFFLLATFFTQITFLNMLIAIMGDTFGRVFENKAQFGLMTKLSIMGDYTVVIQDKTADQDKNNYLFVIKPKLDGNDEGEQVWEGGLGLIKQAVESNVKQTEKALLKDIARIQSQNNEARSRDNTLDKEVRKQYNNITQQFNELKANTKEQAQVFQQKVSQDLVNIKYAQISNFSELMHSMKNLQEQQERSISAQRDLQNNFNSLVLEKKAIAQYQQQRPAAQQLSQGAGEADANLMTSHQNANEQTVIQQKIIQRLDTLSSQVQENEALIKLGSRQSVQDRDTALPHGSLFDPNLSHTVLDKVEALAKRQHDLKSRVERMGSQVKQMTGVMQELRTSQQAFEFNFTQQMTALQQFMQQELNGPDKEAIDITPSRLMRRQEESGASGVNGQVAREESKHD